jgi:hypothetical protein
LPAPISAAKKKQLVMLVKQGESLASAARTAGVSYAFAKNHMTKLTKGVSDSGEGWRSLRENAEAPEPIEYDDLCDEAKRAWHDIGYFAERYFGAKVVPWQAMATENIVTYLESDEKEYVVVNCPPGAGKTTYFSLIENAWLTVRNRAIRGMIVSNTQRNAENYLVNLRRALEQPLPIKASDNDIRLGIAVDAEASLVMDYGCFKTPGESGERWTAKAFQVMQHRGRPVSEKESTWQAFGKGGAFLGNRLDVIVCDDVYDKSMVKTAEARDDFMNWFDKHVETRLEPNGMLLLVGQRQDADDVYRHCLDKVVLIDEDGDDIEHEVDAQKKYHHVIFKAHYDELCTGDHKSVKPYPEGCLLYPGRIKWRDLRSLTPDVLAVEYQQEDVAPGATLVDPLWVVGGKDPASGIEYPGCIDKDRDEWQLPKGLTGEVFVAAAFDPSPTMFWSAQMWAYHPDTEQRFLIAHRRKKMTAPELLDWDLNEKVFSGLMEDWFHRSVALGYPCRYWIVEDNAAQRFMLTNDYAKKWQMKHGVQVVRHNTNAVNKHDPKLGIQALASKWQHGNIRLPGAPYGRGRLDALSLVNEVTKWPNGRTEDAVMAHWFFEKKLPELYVPAANRTVKLSRPTWLNMQPLRSVG